MCQSPKSENTHITTSCQPLPTLLLQSLTKCRSNMDYLSLFAAATITRVIFQNSKMRFFPLFFNYALMSFLWCFFSFLVPNLKLIEVLPWFNYHLGMATVTYNLYRQTTMSKFSLFHHQPGILNVTSETWF